MIVLSNSQFPVSRFSNTTSAKNLAADNELHLSLKKMIKLAKENNIVYQSLSDPILDNQWFPTMETSWLQMPNIISYVALTVSVLASIGCIKLLVKQRALTAMVTSLSSVNSVHSLNVQQFPDLTWKKTNCRSRYYPGTVQS